MNTPTNSHFTLADSIKVARYLEPKLAAIGLHCAVGGSTMYRGTSTKDIDVMLYPHSRGVDMDRKAIALFLENLGFVPPSVTLAEIASNPDSGLIPDVIVTEREGMRVDFFLLSRLEQSESAGTVDAPFGGSNADWLTGEVKEVAV